MTGPRIGALGTDTFTSFIEIASSSLGYHAIIIHNPKAEEDNFLEQAYKTQLPTVLLGDVLWEKFYRKEFFTRFNISD
jgi:hypothetical protein